MPPSCALLGGFVIGARVALLWQHSANAKCQRVLVLALCLVSPAKNRNVCDVVMAAVVKDVNADGSNFLDESRTVAHMNEAGVK